MIEVAICEDSKMDRELLYRIISRLMSDRDLEFRIDTYENGENLVQGYNNHPYDLIFLDIVMGEIDGVKAGQMIRDMDEMVEIIYCTSSKDFAIATYEIHSMGYLLKPYQKDKIGKLIDYYVQRHPQGNKKFIQVKSMRKSVIIPHREILYMESDNKVVYIHTTRQGDVKVYGKLDSLEEQINDNNFLRCHKSYLVNLGYVSGLTDSDFIIDNDDMIPIRKTGRKILVKKYEEFLNRSCPTQ